jgi:hypothetical protein
MDRIGNTGSSYYSVRNKRVPSSDASPPKVPPYNFVALPVSVARPGKMDALPENTVKLFVETLANAKVALMLQPAPEGNNQGIDAPLVSPPEGNETKTASAAEMLKDFLDMSPEKPARANALNSAGITQEDYKHLPLNDKAKIDKQAKQQGKTCWEA